MDEEAFVAILGEIASGIPTWRALADRGIAVGTFYRYRDAAPDRSERYTRAKEIGVEGVVQDGIRIADDPTIEHNHKRIMVDVRKWYASKLAPKLYGDKLELAGEVGLTVSVVQYADKAA